MEQSTRGLVRNHDGSTYSAALCETISGTISQPCAKKMRALFVRLSLEIEYLLPANRKKVSDILKEDEEPKAPEIKNTKTKNSEAPHENNPARVFLRAKSHSSEAAWRCRANVVQPKIKRVLASAM
jgi:hypothetical protein